MICGSELQGNTYLRAQDKLYSGDTYKIEKCLSCGFLFTNPRPTEHEIIKFYHSEEYISHYDKPKSILDRIYRLIKRVMLKRKILLIRKYLETPGKKILDYGCGTGSFVIAAANAGFSSAGYERDDKARMISKQNGAEVLASKNQVFENNTNSFDVITLWHVLEHLHDFPQILKDFYRVLKPGGLIIIAVPIANSADSEHYKEHWAAWDLPRHLLHFTPGTLIKVCNEAGFNLVKRKGMPFDSFYVSLLSEKHKKSKAGIFKAFLIGAYSNIKAIMRVSPWSSEIFIFNKYET